LLVRDARRPISMTRFLHRGLTWITAAYILLMPTAMGKPARDVLWVAAALLGIAALVNLIRGRERWPPWPGRTIVGALAFWMLWGVASVAWTERRAFTLNELRNEVLNNIVLIAIIYYVADSDRAMRTLVLAVIGGFALHACVMLGWSPFTGDGDPFRLHFGIVWVATWLTLSAPFLLLPVLPEPPGFGGGRRGAAVTALLVALLIAAAVVTENRMMWIALAVEAIVLVAFVARRRASPGPRLPGRLVAASLVGATVLAAGFVWTLHERVAVRPGQSEDVATTLRQDPRIDLWKHSLESIADRPWLGHGFGKGITGDAMVRDLGNPLLWHPHNVFLSQWQQTGFVGMAALMVLFTAILWRFFRFARARDDALAVAGAIGLAVVLGFLVKNLTDDFMVRNSAKEFWAYTVLLLGYGTRRAALLQQDKLSAFPERAPGTMR